MVGPILEALERKIGLRRDATRAPLRAPEWQRATSMPRPPRNTQISTRPRLTYCGPKLVLTKGSTLLCCRQFCVFHKFLACSNAFDSPESGYHFLAIAVLVRSRNAKSNTIHRRQEV